MAKTYKIRETFAGQVSLRRVEVFHPVHSIEEAREVFYGLNNIKVVSFEVDAENDAADVFLSSGSLYTVEASYAD